MAILPKDVMIEILSRLPAESLLRFKSVRKSWYALINHPKFIIKHFSNSLRHNHILVQRAVLNNSRENENIISILKLTILSLDGSDFVLDFDFPSHVDFRKFEISGHSHGLLCLSSNILKDVFLCNPTTREFRKLPPSILDHLIDPPKNPEAYNSCTNAVGLGYDLKSKDFKVVRVVASAEGRRQFRLSRVEIYDLSKDKWREIETPVCSYVVQTPTFDIYGGICYWWAVDEGMTTIIQSFDLSEEVFGQISLPEVFEEDNETHTSSMRVLNGSFILFHHPWIGYEKAIDIWKMEKNGIGSISWSKVLTIGPVYEIYRPLFFVSSDEVLMDATQGQIVLYNIGTQQFRELPIKRHSIVFRATFFVRTRPE